VILEVIGHALAGDEPVVGLQLFVQRLVNRALGAIGKARGFVSVIVMQRAPKNGG